MSEVTTRRQNAFILSLVIALLVLGVINLLLLGYYGR